MQKRWLIIMLVWTLPFQASVDLVVKSKTEPRVFSKYGKELKVATAVGVDATGGEIQLSLWNADIDKVNVGDTVKITNGYVSEFNGEKQLTSGKFGKLEVVGAENASEPSEPTEEKAEKPKKGKKSEDIEDVEF